MLELIVLMTTFGFYLDCDRGFSWTLYILWATVRTLSGLIDLAFFIKLTRAIGVKGGLPCLGILKFAWFRIQEELLHFDRLTDF